MGERDHYLHGAEDVRSAANTMSNAADAMRSAAGAMSDAVDKLKNADWDRETVMNRWLDRFEEIVARMPGSLPKPGFMVEQAGASPVYIVPNPNEPKAYGGA